MGDEPDRLFRAWIKPRTWYARCNRDWLVTGEPESNIATWKRHTSFGDTLYFAQALDRPTAVAAAAGKVRAEGSRKGFLWLGLSGKLQATLNGEKIMEEENTTRYRVGQIQKPIELRPGVNQLVFRVEALGNQPVQLAAVLVGPDNNGDSLGGAHWIL